MALFITGSLAYDTIITPFGKRERIVGGAATYAALAASLFTTNIYIISRIGNDFKEEDIAFFARRKISLKYVERDPSHPSFYWAGEYFHDLNTRRTLVTEINALAFMKAPEKITEPCEVLVLGTLEPRLQREILEAFAESPKFVFLDTIAFWIENNRKDLEDLIASGKISMLSINDEEARMWAGEYSLKKCARYFLNKGIPYVSIKKGEHGSLLFTKDGIALFFPALPLEDIKDPTGAGDSFMGAMAGFLHSQKNYDLENIMKGISFASVVASFTVEHFGPEGLLNITPEMVSSRLEEYKQLSSVFMVL